MVIILDSFQVFHLSFVVDASACFSTQKLTNDKYDLLNWRKKNAAHTILSSFLHVHLIFMFVDVHLYLIRNIF